MREKSRFEFGTLFCTYAAMVIICSQYRCARYKCSVSDAFK